ncbi:hypothetical protein HR060_07885 [Catenovulum sp. SM1970]|uniref:hypothetical protein n=1 Tax=Marinifaba aquimaris TaxID=2741323 RepID=UPI001571EC89|nr:hypothetical protein [Marinifaba aquimaris]NTS76789.1 hypothetical protein [Marinifaba aquimaris]
MLPYILVTLSFIIAYVFHYKYPKNFWYANSLSAVVFVVVTLVSAFAFMDGLFANNAESADMPSMMVMVVGLSLFYGFLVSCLLGFFLKTIGLINNK